MGADESSAGEPARHDSIRVLVVDDHAMLRDGTRSMLEDVPDIELVGEADDGVAALAVAAATAPDVVLLDISMPRMDGTKACRLLLQQQPALRILIVTGFATGAGIRRTLRKLGAAGYVSKAAGRRELLAAIRAVYRGEEVFEPDDVAEDSPKLTPKELEVLGEITLGLTNRRIADKLGLTENTVEYHVRHILTKLDAATRAEAIIRAQQRGWLDKPGLLW